MHRLVLLFLLMAPVAASAASYSSLYVFGDSLSDPGNIPLVSGYNYPPAPYSNNQFSNGQVAAQYLAPLLGLPVDNSRNYAQGGATTGYTNTLNSTSGGPLPGASLSGVLGQVDNYLVGGPADPNALFMVWAGPNDLFAGLQDPLNFNAAAAIGTAMGNLSTAINSLANAGAQHFFVPNLPDLGAIPMTMGSPTAAGASQISFLFDQQLAVTLGQLQSGLGVSITSFDSFGLLHDVLDSPGSYGFTNVSSACLVDVNCVLNPATADGYLFWDDVHLTTKGHEVLARSMAASLVAPIPVPAALPLLLSGLLLLAGCARRGRVS